jgi:imidazolonepropionase-like amidohydrolase
MHYRAYAFAAVLCLAHAAHAAEPPALTLFENVRIFDGKSDALSASMNVLVRGNTIEKISKDPIPIDGNAAAKIIAGGGRTLMPGLIDAHWHAMLVRPTPAQLLVDDVMVRIINDVFPCRPATAERAK